MRPYRIAHLTNAMSWDGTGLTNHTVDLAITQARSGHSVAILCRSADERMRRLLDVHDVRLIEGVDASTPAALLRSARACAPLLRTSDVVHVHTVRATLVAMFSAPWSFATRSVATLHNPYQRSVIAMYLTTRVVSISEADQRYVRRRTLGLRRPVVILNGMLGTPRLPDIASLQPADLPPHSIVYVGALYARKGVDVLLKAMLRVRAAVPEARLFLVGNRDNPRIEQLATDLGVEDVTTFVGFSPDPRDYMKAAAVVVLPSRAEGFGNVITEARSAGSAIVASNVGGIPEALSGGSAGLLVEPEDEEGLARALVSVLTDPVLAERLRAAALAGLESSTVERLARANEAVYASLPGRRGVKSDR